MQARNTKTIIINDIIAPPEYNRTMCTLGIYGIKKRINQDLRRVNLEHMIAIAKSVLQFGSLSPINVDTNHHLITGRHNLFACRLLALPPEERKPWVNNRIDAGDIIGKLTPNKEDELLSLDRRPPEIEACINEFDSAKYSEYARQLEVIENEKRKNLEKEEVINRYKELAAMGYRSAVGKPKIGEITITSIIEREFGINAKTIWRYMNSDTAKEKARPTSYITKKVASNFLTSIEKFIKDAEQIDNDAIENIIRTIFPLISELKAITKPTQSESAEETRPLKKARPNQKATQKGDRSAQ
jgi:hypothetical protein